MNIDKGELVILLSRDGTDFLKANARCDEGVLYTLESTLSVVDEVDGRFLVKETPSLHARDVAIDFAIWIRTEDWYFVRKQQKWFNENGQLLSEEELFKTYLQSKQ